MIMLNTPQKWEAALNSSPIHRYLDWRRPRNHSRNVLFALATTSTFVLIAAHSAIHTQDERSRATSRFDIATKAVIAGKQACLLHQERVASDEVELQKALSVQALARCAPEVQSDRAANLLTQARALRDEENAAYLKTRDLGKEVHQADVANDKAALFHAKTGLETTERARQDLAKRAAITERALYDEERLSAAKRTRAQDMFAAMQNSATSVERLRAKLADSARTRDVCESGAQTKSSSVRRGSAPSSIGRTKDC